MQIDVNSICEKYYNETLPNVYNDATPGYRTFMIALCIIFYLFGLISFVTFLATKHWVVYSKQKSITAAIIYFLGFYFALTASVLRDSIGRKNFPCQLLAWTHHLPVICLVSQPVGLMYFYIYKLRKERVKTLAIKKMFSEDAENKSIASGAEPSVIGFLKAHKEKEASMRLMDHIIDFIFVLRHSKNGKIIIQEGDTSDDARNNQNFNSITETFDHAVDMNKVLSVDLVSHATKMNPTLTVNNSETEETIKQYTWKQMLLEQVGIPLMMMGLFGFPYPIAIALRIQLDPIYAAGCNGCSLTYVDEFMKLACGGLFIPLAFQGLYAMRNEPDPLRIIAEMKYAVFWGNIVVACYIPNIIFSFLGTGDRIDIAIIQIFGVAGAYYILGISGVIVAVLEKKKVNAFKVGKQTIPLLSSSLQKETMYSVVNPPPYSALDLDLILAEPKARSALLEHSITEISSENVVFVFKLRAWKSMWDKEKAEKLSKIAERLFREFISKESNAPINISYNAYAKAERDMNQFLASKIKDANIKPRKDIFDDCEAECFKMMEYDALPRFCRSEIFKKEIIEAGILDKILR